MYFSVEFDIAIQRPVGQEIRELLSRELLDLIRGAGQKVLQDLESVGVEGH